MQPSLTVTLGPETQVVPHFLAPSDAWWFSTLSSASLLTSLGSPQLGHLHRGALLFEPGGRVLLLPLSVGRGSSKVHTYPRLHGSFPGLETSASYAPVLSPLPVVCLTQGLSQEALESYLARNLFGSL